MTMDGEQSISDFIQKYLERGFGSMSKNDFEVWIFHCLLQDKYRDKSDFEISCALKIPESKVKRLRYESELCYPDTDEEGRRLQLKEAICQATYREARGQIAFAIDNKMLRSYLAECLRKDHRYYDSSFVSNIVVVSACDFIYILEKIILTEEERISIMQKVKDEMSDGEKPLPKSLTEISGDLAKSFCKQIASNLVGKTSEELIDCIIDSIKKY